MEVNNLIKTCDALNSIIDNLELKCDGATESDVDMDLLKLCVERFQMFIDDGVPEAITTYLNALCKRNINKCTLYLIIHAGAKMLG